MHKPPPRPIDEEERLATLRKYRILDTAPEPQFDRIVEVAKRQFGVPLAMVTFMDAERNFLKGRGAMPMTEAPRDISFCGYTILQDEVLVVPDTTKDGRFAENPLVVGDPKFRFYAGAPLVAPNGQSLGTVCVFDIAPRNMDEADQQRLKDLADIVTDHLEMRLAVGDVHEEIETRRNAEAAAQRLAMHDTLTGLPNRAALNEFMAKPSPRNKFARHVFYADLDSFKRANDTLGHLAGDEILRRAAEAMQLVLGPDAFVARISGDEFIAFIDDVPAEEVDRSAHRILDILGEPYLFGDHLFTPGMSIGIAAARSSDDHPTDLLRRADLALTAAKEAGGRRVVWHDSEMGQRAERRHQLITDLHRALDDGTIEVHYQTINDATDGRIIGVEALARWTHPRLGPIEPSEFITLAEESGQIVRLGDQVLQQALRDAAAWPELFISVNLSPLQFRTDDLAGHLLAMIDDAGFPTRLVQFEITESALLQDTAVARREIAALQDRGARVALDDFGTGYSSLSYLKAIPFDKVKIDRSFVNGIEDDRFNATIVQHIVSLAHQLDMRVTAEGVETESQETLLRAAGCNSFQGYRFGRPVPAEEITRQLTSKTRGIRRAS
jgi:diguanylate cyclase (GGDEF)-like protein